MLSGKMICINVLLLHCMHKKSFAVLLSLFSLSILLLVLVMSGVFQERTDETPIEQTEQEANDRDEVSFKVITSLGQKELNGMQVRSFRATIENPTTGDDQAVWLLLPETDEELPLVVMVQGGSGDGENFVRSDRNEKASPAELFASNGLVVIAYSALGVGDSEGEQNYHGYDDQDGLAAIVEAGKALREVDASRVGFASFSYGVTAAAGVLARYPELGISFYSDWEGPSSREYTTVGCGTSGKYGEPSSPASKPCADETFWKEREAADLMRQVTGLKYYWRIQEKKDHVQSTYEHTVEMMEAVEASDVPWFRLNDGEVNHVYDIEDIPVVPNANQYTEYAIPHVLEMIQMLE